MLPFLKQKKQTGVQVIDRKPDEKPEEEHDDNGLKACAEDILRAISQNDAEHLALALQSAFEVMEASPHEESPHTYESQNQKAAGEQE